MQTYMLTSRAEKFPSDKCICYEITRVKRYYQDVIPRNMPNEFRSHFRLSRETFETLCTRIANCAALYILRKLIVMSFH